jgi:hypothetical protein
MDKREAGKKSVEEFVTKVARGMKQETTPYEFLWWPEIPAEAAGEGMPNDMTIPLRVYKGNSWRSIDFAGSDIDGSADNPDLLNKYENEVAQCLGEL